MKVRFTPSAEAQLEAAIRYIRRDRPSSAVTFGKKAKQKSRHLESYPNSGRTVPEYAHSLVREVIIPPYRFFYKEVEKTIWILAVWREAQLPEKPSI